MYIDIAVSRNSLRRNGFLFTRDVTSEIAIQNPFVGAPPKFFPWPSLTAGDQSYSAVRNPNPGNKKVTKANPIEEFEGVQMDPVALGGEPIGEFGFPATLFLIRLANGLTVFFSD